MDIKKLIEELNSLLEDDVDVDTEENVVLTKDKFWEDLQKIGKVETGYYNAKTNVHYSAYVKIKEWPDSLTFYYDQHYRKVVGKNQIICYFDSSFTNGVLTFDNSINFEIDAYNVKLKKSFNNTITTDELVKELESLAPEIKKQIKEYKIESDRRWRSYKETAEKEFEQHHAETEAIFKDLEEAGFKDFIYAEDSDAGNNIEASSMPDLEEAMDEYAESSIYIDWFFYEDENLMIGEWNGYVCWDSWDGERRGCDERDGYIYLKHWAENEQEEDLLTYVMNKYPNSLLAKYLKTYQNDGD